MGQRKTFRSELRACAVEQHGYVTSDDTLRLGIPDEVLEQLLGRGDLVTVTDDLFRLDGVPAGRHHALAEAVLRVGPRAHLSHDAVLALQELTDRDPRPVRVTTPATSAGTVPDHVQVLHGTLPAQDLTTYRGIRCTTVARALLDCRDLLTSDELLAAADGAVRRGLLLRRERHAVLEALRSP